MSSPNGVWIITGTTFGVGAVLVDYITSREMSRSYGLPLYLPVLTVYRSVSWDTGR